MPIERLVQVPAPRILSLRYDGTCSACKAQLPRRTRAWWYAEEKRIVCFACMPEQADAAVAAAAPGAPALEADTHPADPVAVAEPDTPLVWDGEAGASARREAARRRAKREKKTMERHPRLGRVILAVSDEPQSIRSWDTGADGEDVLGVNLNKIANERLVVLHDRRVPRSSANIDHIAITPGGVFVIDAKHYAGRVAKRDHGGLFSKDVRLHVGRRDCTKLVLSSEDQAEVIRDALAPLDFSDVPVLPVLCFVGADWGLFASPLRFGSVLVTWPKALYEQLKKNAEVETAVIQETARQLAAALPRA